jgi:hypothetical protein
LNTKNAKTNEMILDIKGTRVLSIEPPNKNYAVPTSRKATAIVIKSKTKTTVPITHKAMGMIFSYTGGYSRDDLDFSI